MNNRPDDRNRFQKLIDAIISRIVNGPAWRVLYSPPRFDIDRLNLRLGDKLVVKFHGRLTPQIADRLRAQIEPQIRSLIPAGEKVLIIDDSVDLAIIRSHQITTEAA